MLPAVQGVESDDVEESSSSSDSRNSDHESDVSDDALSLAELLNALERGERDCPPESPPSFVSSHPEPPLPTFPSQDRLRLTRILGASAATHFTGAGRERMLCCGAGAVWTLGREVGEAPRFLPAGIAASGC